MGLRTGAHAGITSASFLSVAGFSSGRTMPYSSAASVAATQPMPVMENTPMRFPRGRGSFSKADKVSKNASGLCVRTRPVLRQTASNTASDPASEPVCDATAAAPASLRPAFITTTGFFLLAFSAALMKRRPSITPSRYMPTVRVTQSSARYSRRSLSLMSPLLPMQATLASPKGLVSAIQRAQPDEKTPDWPMIDTPPALIGSRPTMDVAMPAEGLSVPMLLGPMIRISALRACSIIIFCSSAPALPASEYPPVLRMMLVTLFALQSSKASGTAVLGITIMAKSTGAGTSQTFA